MEGVSGIPLFGQLQLGNSSSLPCCHASSYTQKPDLKKGCFKHHLFYKCVCSNIIFCLA